MDAQSQNIKSLANGESQSASTGFLSGDQRDILRIFLRSCDYWAHIGSFTASRDGHHEPAQPTQRRPPPGN